MVAHIAYGLFFATAAVCLVRGMFLWSLHFVNKAKEAADHDRLAGATPLPSVVPAAPPAAEQEAKAA
jgi:hypothetical protein